jgi:hypothetical protein
MMMDAKGLYLLKTTNHQTGLIGSDETVIIKGNFQWASRCGTNTDRIKGLINNILNHPDGFTGEILVCDNAQGANGDWSSCNNSEDASQTILDVVNTFKAKSKPVSLVQWDNIMGTTVTEYNAGNMTSGFTYNATTKVTYPKFQTPKGTYVSMKYGIWNTGNSTYDRTKLCIINMPVCKAHGYTGATLAIKNWVGMMSLTDKTGRYGTEEAMHVDYFMKETALPARVIAEVTPDLNIIDATWSAPSDNYSTGQAFVNTKTILASTDPIAISWYAAKFILMPVATTKNFVNPDRAFTGTPSLSTPYYGYCFKNWANYLITTAGMNFTRDSSKISVFDRKAIGVATAKLIKDEEYISVYPNPTSDQLNITCNKMSGSLKYKIFNSLGQPKMQQICNGSTTKINIQNWESGVYLIQLWEGKNLVGTKRIIKQ